MKIKYNTSPIYNILLFTFMTATGVFTILRTPLLSSLSFQYSFIFIVAAGLYFNTLINTSLHETVNAYSGYFKMVTVYLIFFIIVHSIYAYIHYDENLRQIYAVFKIFCYLFLFYPIIYVIHQNHGYDKLLKTIAIITLIVFAAYTICAVIYNYSGQLIFPALKYSIRHNRLRIDFPALAGIMIIYYFSKFLSASIRSKAFWKYTAIILFLCFYEVYINMTRMYIITLAVTFLVMFFVKRHPKNKRILYIALILIVFIILLSTNTLTAFFETFSEDSEDYGGSTLARRLAREYMIQFPQNNPFLGMGFLCPDTPRLALIMYGPEGIFSMDDLGILNMFYNYGLSGIVLTVLIFARLLYCAAIIFINNRERSLIVSGIVTWIACSCASLCIFDMQRMLALPLYWAIIEYEYKQCAPHKKGRIRLSKSKQSS